MKSGSFAAIFRASFPSGWSLMQQGRRRRDLVRKSVVRNESIPDWIFPGGARRRSKIQSAAIGSADRCEGIVGRKSLGSLSSSFLTSFVPRCSRAGTARRGAAREQETVPLRRTKARSRFQFGRALATNYSGRRALLHACRCAVDAAKTTVERLTFRAFRGGSSSRGSPRVQREYHE